jgi:hypothetical protein
MEGDIDFHWADSAFESARLDGTINLQEKCS